MRSDPVRRTILAMDTVMNLTVCQNGKDITMDKALDELTACINTLDKELSATGQESPIYALNHAQGGWTALSERGCDLLDRALALCAATGGALDLTAYPAVEAWGFPSGEYRVVSPDECAQLAGRINYAAVERKDGQARLPEGMALDMGAVAKGYAGDILAARLGEMGITSALLDLGQSSIQAIGAKPDGSPWRVGIQDPDSEGYLGVLSLSDCGMGTSGNYQRFFEEDGVTYCHIIDPAAAAPAQTGLSSVTVVSPSGLLCDGLSTALFVMGLDKATQFWHDHPELGFDALFITDKGKIYLTPGLADSFTLAEGEQREVTVLS